MSQMIYLSDYKDYASQARLYAYRNCGHYPLVAGSPCARCIDVAIARAYRDGMALANWSA